MKEDVRIRLALLQAEMEAHRARKRRKTHVIDTVGTALSTVQHPEASLGYAASALPILSNTNIGV